MSQNFFAQPRRLAALRWVLLAFAVVASAAAAAVTGFVICLVIGAYSGGNDPQSVSALAFPIAFLVMIVVGVPVVLVCTLAWAGYCAAARRLHQFPR